MCSKILSAFQCLFNIHTSSERDSVRQLHKDEHFTKKKEKMYNIPLMFSVCTNSQTYSMGMKWTPCWAMWQWTTFWPPGLQQQHRASGKRHSCRIVMYLTNTSTSPSSLVTVMSGPSCVLQRRSLQSIYIPYVDMLPNLMLFFYWLAVCVQFDAYTHAFTSVTLLQ